MTRRLRTNRLARRLPIILLVLGALIAVAGLQYVSRQAEQRQQVVLAVSAERDSVAQDLRDVAGAQSALCSAGGPAARALDAAGLCGRARDALASAVVQQRTTALTAGQIDAIVGRVLAATPPTSTDDAVREVLAKLDQNPQARGLSEAEVRAVVSGAVNAQPQPPAGASGVAGPPGASFGGLTFIRRDGQCIAVVVFIEANGTRRTSDTVVSNSVCDPPAQPPPDPTPAAPAEPTPDPQPAPAEEPPPDPQPAPDPQPEPVDEPDPAEQPADDEPDPGPDPEPAPADEPAPDLTPDVVGGGLLDGILGGNND